MAVVDISNTFQMSNVGEHIDNTDVYNSNENLLDNAYFFGTLYPINQRGQTTYTGQGYTIDRWYHSNSRGTTEVKSNYIALTANSTGNAYLRQTLPQPIRGTFTLSAWVHGNGSGGGLVFYDADGNALASTVFDATTTWTCQSVTCTAGSSAPIVAVAIRANTGTTVNYNCIKLERGSFSTLQLNDFPGSYAKELATCQRYFYRLPFVTNYPIGYGYAQNTTSFRIAIPIPVSMRAAVSSISFNGSLYMIGQGSSIAVTALSASGIVPTSYVDLAGTVSGATQFQSYVLVGSDTGYIDISADL